LHFSRAAVPIRPVPRDVSNDDIIVEGNVADAREQGLLRMMTAFEVSFHPRINDSAISRVFSPALRDRRNVCARRFPEMNARRQSHAPRYRFQAAI